MHERDRHAAPLQSPRRFEAEQAAADDHRAPVALCGADHRLDIGDVAEGAHIGQSEAGNRRRQRLRPGGQQQFVVGDGSPVGERDVTRGAIDRRRAASGNQANAVLVVPAPRIDDDFVERLVARQHRRQQDAVVVRVRLRHR